MKASSPLQIVSERCAGLDVHKRTVQACANTLEATGRLHKQRHTFSTMTADVLVMRDWFKAEGITHVALESTGVLWKPISNLLEGHVEIMVVNAQHIKAVRGAKDGHQRGRVDGRSPPARPLTSQLYPASRASCLT